MPIDSSDRGAQRSYSMSFWLFVVGVVILLGTSFWLLRKGNLVNADDLYYHNLANLLAVCLIVGAWWLRSDSTKNEPEPMVEKLKDTARQGKKKVVSWLDKLTSGGSTDSTSKPAGDEERCDKSRSFGKSFLPPSGERAPPPSYGGSSYGEDSLEARNAREIQRLFQQRNNNPMPSFPSMNGYGYGQ